MRVIESLVLFLAHVVLSSCQRAIDGTEGADGRVLREATRPTISLHMFDPIRGYLNWMQPRFIEHARSQCPTTKCVITAKPKDADMIIFHAPTHGKSSRRFPAAGNVKPGAIFTLFSMEQPQYARFLKNTADLSKNFHLTATYNQQRTYPGTSPPVPNMALTYYPLNIVSVEEVLKEALPWEEKTGFDTGVSVVVFVSNCKAAGAEQRVRFLTDLMQYMPVHSYGGCLNNRKEPQFPHDPSWPNQRRANKVKVVSRYKFYLAFENLQVNDYVSEKVFEGLFAGAVPVYRGAKEISNFMPADDSFIDANGMSAGQLATLLKLLAAEESKDKYDKFFAFKKRPLPQRFYEMASNSYCHPNILCRMCEFAAHNRTSATTYA